MLEGKSEYTSNLYDISERDSQVRRIQVIDPQGRESSSYEDIRIGLPEKNTRNMDPNSRL